MISQDKIFHYTSIESLAMILSSKKLRFSRLDRLDDVLEAQKYAGIEFGKYFFASCWTQQAEESIPQWSFVGHVAAIRLVWMQEVGQRRSSCRAST